MESIIMSKKEIRYGEIIPQVINGKISQSNAAIVLGISIRQVKRLSKNYREKGLLGLIHKGRGKPSNRKISPKIKEDVLKIIRKKYPDFSYQLIHEQLQEKHEIFLSAEWIRQTMIKEGDRQVNTKKVFKYYQPRPRRSRRGELIQIDGSYHDWFEDRGPKCCLLVAIDDATSELCELRFVEHETTCGYMSLIKDYIDKRGRPLAFYSDRLNVFSGGSQLRRALQELDIALINANSPQAKGRVERANGTLQDRLIKHMRLENINSIEEANQYLERYIFDHNKRFGKQPKIDEDAHKAYLRTDLNMMLCVKEERKVSKDLTIKYNNMLYMLVTEGIKYRLQGKTALISEVEGMVHIEVEGKEYRYTTYEERPYIESMNRKQVDAWLDHKKPLTIIERRRKGMSVNF